LIKEQLKDIKSYEKRVSKICKIENEYRTEMLEHLYSLCYPMFPLPKAGKAGFVQVPSTVRDRAKAIEKKNEKVEKAVGKMYIIPMKKVGDVDPKRLDYIIKVPIKGEKIM